MSDIGPKRFYQLLDYFGSPDIAWQAKSGEISKILNLSSKISSRLFEEKNNILPEEELNLVSKNKIQVLTIEDLLYPENLKNIHYPPPLLYFKGNILESDKNSISIVGSRKATYYGKMVAEKLSKDLALAGLTVISGLARGIDTAAHKGAISVNGRTIAVLGCGIDHIYPPENRRLAEEIEGSGALISEFPLYTLPERKNFPRRNRVISGLSLGTVVVEAAEKSGALITADFALEQGREVFAIPGNINSPLSNGSHNLIKQGAKLVENFKDILEEIHIVLPQKTTNRKVVKENTALTEEEKRIYQVISKEPIQIDYIIGASKLSAGKASEVLLNLELKDLIKEIEGKRFIKL
ncbi:MAG TPA: DNA-protecting protein DprA [Candidatus Atribacteria bacterium]|nr:DNA-protecting protein DprA [Candidatus Atribacteria bacterium]